jgi:general secretion pathway protein D
MIKKNIILFLLFCLTCPLYAEEKGKFTLNMQNADIRTLISSVSKQTGKNFLIDPRVKGRINVVSHHKLNSDDLYHVFLSILQVNGFTAVETDNITKIIPITKVKQTPTPILNKKHSLSDEIVTHVYNPTHVSAQTLVPILRPLLPQQAHLGAYANSNTLIFTDTLANIKRILSIVKKIDKPDNSKIEVILLKNATAKTITQTIRTLLQKQKTKNKALIADISADERTNSVIISGSKPQRLQMRTLIAHLDTPLPDDRGNVNVIYLHYADATDLAKILNDLQNKNRNRNKKFKNISDNEMVSIQAHKTTNSLIITAPSSKMKNIKDIIAKLDIRRAQVLIEAIVVEISEEKAREFGVETAADGRGNDTPSGAINFGGIANVVSSTPSLPSGLVMGIGKENPDGVDFGVLLRALASDSSSNILSTPSIVTLDNEEAKIVVGQNVPFVTGQYTTTNSGSGSSSSTNISNPFQTIERQDIGLTLKVTPQINEGSSIRMKISQEVSNVLPSAQSSSDLITSKRSIDTTVIVEDGQTLVLGGLIDEKVIEKDSKVPLLGDIPVLGWLFSYKTKSKVKQNLMVFIHPKILRDAISASEESMKKYSYMRELQLKTEEESNILLDGSIPILPELKVRLNLNKNIKKSKYKRRSRFRKKTKTQ